MNLNSVGQGWLMFLCVMICLMVGFIGSFATRPAIPTWYQGLNKPAFTPPSYVFAPVWSTLYTIMGISLFLVVSRGLSHPPVAWAAGVFAIQLALNLAWSLLFFGLRSPALGMLDISLLWVAIGVTIFMFWRVSPAAAILLVPYLLWVSFAALLNFSIWRLNP
jgi:tryptophan-rich sensory protein